MPRVNPFEVRYQVVRQVDGVTDEKTRRVNIAPGAFKDVLPLAESNNAAIAHKYLCTDPKAGRTVTLSDTIYEGGRRVIWYLRRTA